MGKIILDSMMQSKLGGLHEPLEFEGEGGEALGMFLPKDRYQKLLYQLAESQRPSLSADEIQRRRQNPARKSLAEVLQTLAQPPASSSPMTRAAC